MVPRQRTSFTCGVLARFGGVPPCFELFEALGRLLQQRKAGEGGGAAQRIGCEAVAMEEGL